MSGRGHSPSFTASVDRWCYYVSRSSAQQEHHPQLEGLRTVLSRNSTSTVNHSRQRYNPHRPAHHRNPTTMLPGNFLESYHGSALLSPMRDSVALPRLSRGSSLVTQWGCTAMSAFNLSPASRAIPAAGRRKYARFSPQRASTRRRLLNAWRTGCGQTTRKRALQPAMERVVAALGQIAEREKRAADRQSRAAAGGANRKGR
jgi:hypothetical protein